MSMSQDELDVERFDDEASTYALPDLQDDFESGEPHRLARVRRAARQVLRDIEQAERTPWVCGPWAAAS